MAKPRLPQDHIDYIRELAQQLFHTQKVWIFGSRANPHAKGGDIDVFIKTELPQDVRLAEKKLDFQDKLQLRFGMQRIDVVVQAQGSDEQPIFRIAQTEGVAI